MVIKFLTVRSLNADAVPKRTVPERGCVRRTSRSRIEDEETLKHSNALLPALALRLGRCPQPRSVLAFRSARAGQDLVVPPLSVFSPNCLPWVRRCALPMVGSRGMEKAN